MKVADTITKPLELFCENKAAVFFSNNNKRSLACKLMDMKYLKVRYEVRRMTIDIEHIGTCNMVADSMTKALLVGVFKKYVHDMGVHETFDSANEWE